MTGGQEVASSSLVTPTILSVHNQPESWSEHSIFLPLSLFVCTSRIFLQLFLLCGYAFGIYYTATLVSSIPHEFVTYPYLLLSVLACAHDFVHINAVNEFSQKRRQKLIHPHKFSDGDNEFLFSMRCTSSASGFYNSSLTNLHRILHKSSKSIKIRQDLCYHVLSRDIVAVKMKVQNGC